MTSGKDDEEFFRQRGFGLGEPQGHRHGAIHLDCGGQFRPGLLALAGGGVESAWSTTTSIAMVCSHLPEQ